MEARLGRGWWTPVKPCAHFMDGQNEAKSYQVGQGDLVSGKLGSSPPLNSSASVSSSVNQTGGLGDASRGLEPVRGQGRSCVRQSWAGPACSPGLCLSSCFPLTPHSGGLGTRSMNLSRWELQPRGDALGKPGPSLIAMNFPGSRPLSAPRPGLLRRGWEPHLHLGGMASSEKRRGSHGLERRPLTWRIRSGLSSGAQKPSPPRRPSHAQQMGCGSAKRQKAEAGGRPCRSHARITNERSPFNRLPPLPQQPARLPSEKPPATRPVSGAAGPGPGGQRGSRSWDGEVRTACSSPSHTSPCLCTGDNPCCLLPLASSELTLWLAFDDSGLCGKSQKTNSRCSPTSPPGMSWLWDLGSDSASPASPALFPGGPFIVLPPPPPALLWGQNERRAQAWHGTRVVSAPAVNFPGSRPLSGPPVSAARPGSQHGAPRRVATPLTCEVGVGVRGPSYYCAHILRGEEKWVPVETGAPADERDPEAFLTEGARDQRLRLVRNGQRACPSWAFSEDEFQERPGRRPGHRLSPVSVGTWACFPSGWARPPG